VGGVGLEQVQASDWVEGSVLHGPFVAFAGGPGLSSGHFVHRHLPGAGGHAGIGRGQVGAGDLEVEDRLAEGFVLRVQQGRRFRFVLGSEAQLLSGGGVLGVEDPCAPEQDKPLIHVDAFHSMNREAVRHYRVSS
jgi:hypothetical protein